MTYTAAQLTAGYTAANDGVAPNAALQATIASQAAASANGQLTDADALGAMIHSALSTTDVAVQAYQFFTGQTPSKAGLDFLVNSATNPSDLNDPYYAQFNDENRYINFAANLGLIGEGATAFKGTYGAMTFSAFVASIYETIIGSAYINSFVGNSGAAAAAIADVISRQAAFTQTARDRGLITASSSATDIDIATKAAAVGYLMYEGVKANLGIYAAGANNFVSALIGGTAQYNVNLLTTYSVLGGGIGSPLPPAGVTTTLTSGSDTVTGTTGNDTVNGIVYSDSGTPPFVTTFSGIDTLNGGSGADTLNLTVTRSSVGATGSLTIPTANVTSFEIINVTSLSTNVGDIVTLSGAGFAGATTFNSLQSTNAVTFTNLPTGATVGLIPPTNGVALGDLSFGYATPTAAAILNLATGYSFAAITITSMPAVVTINSIGSAVNNPGVIDLGGSANAVTLNASTPIIFGSGINGFGTGASITVNGVAGDNIAAALGPGVAPGVSFLLDLPANVVAVNASGLSATGIFATIGANPAIKITGGAGSDFIAVDDGTGAALSGTINGGGGTDVVSFDTAADLTAASGARFTNFEILNVSNTGGAATLQAYDASLISGITSEWVQASSGSVQLNNLAAAPTVTVFGNLLGTNALGALSLRVANAGGAADSLTLALNNFNATAAAGIAGVTVAGLQLGGSVTLGQVETLNVVSGGTITSLISPAYNSLTLAASGIGPNFVDPNTVNVTGSQGLSLSTGALGHNITINAAAATGGLQFQSTAGTSGANFTTNVNGTSANDTITYGANQNGTVLGGGGGDLISLTGATLGITVAYKAGSDSLLDLTGTAGASGFATANTGLMDTIQGFVSGSGDKIQLVDLGAAFNAPQVIADKGAAASAGAVTSLLATANFFQDSTNTVRHVAQFDYNGGTLLVADADNNGVYSSGDLVVFIAGVSQIAASDLVGS